MKGAYITEESLADQLGIARSRMSDLRREGSLPEGERTKKGIVYQKDDVERVLVVLGLPIHQIYELRLEGHFPCRVASLDAGGVKARVALPDDTIVFGYIRKGVRRPAVGQYCWAELAAFKNGAANIHAEARPKDFFDYKNASEKPATPEPVESQCGDSLSEKTARYAKEGGEA